MDAVLALEKLLRDASVASSATRRRSNRGEREPHRNGETDDNERKKERRGEKKKRESPEKHMQKLSTSPLTCPLPMSLHAPPFSLAPLRSSRSLPCSRRASAVFPSSPRFADTAT